MSEIILVRAVQTCEACPSQWNAWDLDGRYWYLRFRHARGTMGRDYVTDQLAFKADSESGLDGMIELEEFCRRIGVHWLPELAGRVTEFEAAPNG